MVREALRPWESRAPGSASRCTPSLDSLWSACSAWATCPGIGPSRASWLMGLPRPAISLRRLHHNLLTLSSSSPTTKGTTTSDTTAQISRPQRWTGWQLKASSWRIITSSPYVRLLGASSSLAGRHGPGPRDWVSKSPTHPHPVGRLQTCGTALCRDPRSRCHRLTLPVTSVSSSVRPSPSLGLSFPTLIFNACDLPCCSRTNTCLFLSLSEGSFTLILNSLYINRCEVSSKVT